MPSGSMPCLKAFVTVQPPRHYRPSSISTLTCSPRSSRRAAMDATEHSEWIAHDERDPDAALHTNSHPTIAHPCVVETAAQKLRNYRLTPQPSCEAWSGFPHVTACRIAQPPK